jgi:beta-lactamase regulating signal transducer with metallopeptidase domain
MNGIEWMNLADAAGAWLLTYLLHSTALLVPALLLARFLGQRRLSLQESVLRVALLGALLTSGLQVGLGWEATTGSIPYPTARSTSAPVETAMALEAESVRAERGAERPRRESPALTTSQGSGLEVSSLTLAVGLWASVGLFLVGRLVFLASRLQRRLRLRSDLESGSIFRLFWRLLAISDVDKPTRLTRTDRLDVPIALGVGRREICLPDRVVNELPKEQQETVLAHELAHIERHDPAWLLLARALESLLFVQPLNRVARRKLQEIAEYRCDDWAAEQTGHPLTLAKCLTAVATWSADRRLAGLAPTMAGRRSGLGQRVRRLLDPKYTGLDARMPSWWRPLAGVGLILVLVAVPGFSVVEQEPLSEVAETAEAESAPLPAEAPHAEPAPVPDVEAVLMEVPDAEDAPIVRPDLIAGEGLVVPEGPPALAPVSVAPSALGSTRASAPAPVVAVSPAIAGVVVSPSVAPVSPAFAATAATPHAATAPAVPDADEVKVETRIASRIIPKVVVSVPPAGIAKRVVVKHNAAIKARVKIQTESDGDAEADAQDESDGDGEWDIEWDFDEDEWEEFEDEMEALEDEIDEIVDEIEESFEDEIESVTDAIEEQLDLIEEEIENTIEAELEVFEEEFESLFEVFEDELEVLEDRIEERLENSDSERQEERFEADLEQLEDSFDDLADRLDDQLDGIEDRIESQLETILEPMFDGVEMDYRLDEIEERIEREGERMEMELERVVRAAHERGDTSLSAEERDRLLAEARRLAEAARPTAEEIEILQAELARMSGLARPSREQLDQLREELQRELSVLKTQAAEGLAVSREELRRLGEKHSG